MIETTDLSKNFDGHDAVINLNLKVEPGELFCFLGPNGAGKTTTIKMLTGLLIPTSGSALIGGFDMQKDPVQAKRLIGYVPDRPYLYEKLTGRDFMTFVGDMFGVSRVVQSEKMEEYFALLDLKSAQDQFIENYSHGMRQKLVIASALMHDPEIVVIDEPMVGLDPKSAKTVKNLFKVAAQNGKTVFLSTHTLSVAEELADRIGVINRGELIFLGSIAQLRAELKHSGNLEELFLHLTEEAEMTAE